MTLDSTLKRLQYRSGHRGCKETDLILGQFSAQKLHGLNAAQLSTYEQLLDEDDAHIWEWLLGRNVPSQYRELLSMMEFTGE